MSGPICSVHSCSNSYIKHKLAVSEAAKLGVKTEKLRFFTFPTDPAMQVEWMKACNRDERDFNPTYKRVCGKHFDYDDFEDGIRSKIMNKQPRLLKKNAIPSHCLSPEEDSQTEESKQNQTDVRSKFIQQILITANISKMDKLSDSEQYLSKLVPIAPKESKPSKYLKRKYSKYIEEQKMVDKNSENASMNHQIATLKYDNENLRKKIRELQQIEIIMEQRIKELDVMLEKERKEFHKKIEERMKNFLSTEQLSVVLEKKSKNEWTDEEYAKAYSLRHLSKAAYNHVKNTLLYPLPSLENLQQWAKEFLDTDIDFENDGPIPPLADKYQHYVDGNDDYDMDIDNNYTAVGNNDTAAGNDDINDTAAGNDDKNDIAAGNDDKNGIATGNDDKNEIATAHDDKNDTAAVNNNKGDENDSTDAKKLTEDQTSANQHYTFEYDVEVSSEIIKPKGEIDDKNYIIFTETKNNDIIASEEKG